MQDTNEVLKTLGFVFGLLIWMFAFRVLWPTLSDFVPISNLLAYILWWSLPFVGFLLNYYRKRENAPSISQL